MSGYEPVSAASTDYDFAPPALLFGPPGAARSGTADMIREAGLRLADVDNLEAAAARIGRQVALGIIWVEAGEAMIPVALLDTLAHQAAIRPGQVVVSTKADQIDPVVAALGAVDAQLLVDGNAVDRGGALAVAMAQRNAPFIVSDVGRDNAARLRQISDEMGRIAASLARLSSDGPQGAPSIAAPSVATDLPNSVDGNMVRAVIRARRARARYFSEELFADPAWDIMLDLLQAEIAQHRVPVSSLCIAAAVPATTALRWIKSMTDSGLLVRRADPHDGRRVFVELAPPSSAALRRYFAEIGNPGVI